MQDKAKMMHDWYLRNKELKLEQNKKYHAAHKELIAARHRDNYRRACGLPEVEVKKYWEKNKKIDSAGYEKYMMKQCEKSHILGGR
ncbi:MAG: hypothetical protein K5907_07445 [Treponema sp.]|nr:hypothetical protein [Treponema sp.]